MSIVEKVEKNSVAKELEAIKQLRLECLLQQRHSEFIDIMYRNFGLEQRPSNISIRFKRGNYDGMLFVDRSKYSIGINEKFSKEPLEENLGIELIAPHETAHYLHALRQSEFYVNDYRSLTDKEIRYKERIAELASLIFLDESGRGGAKKYWSLNWECAGKPMDNGRPYLNKPEVVVCTWSSNMDNMKLAKERLKVMASISRAEFELMSDHDLLHEVVLFNGD